MHTGVGSSITQALCVFCGARNEVPSAYHEVAAILGRSMAERGIRLVYGGGKSGLMGTLATAVMQHGGHVTGIFPCNLPHLEPEHTGLSEMIRVDGMHERKRVMFERSDAVIVLPGGFGTLDEMFEVLTWKQLHLHQKPIVILNHQGYWGPLIALMESVIRAGFAAEDARKLYQVVSNVNEIFTVTALKK